MQFLANSQPFYSLKDLMKDPSKEKIHKGGLLQWKAKGDTSVTLPCFGIQHDKVQ